MSPGRVTTLATCIQEEVTKLENHLQSQGLPSPSFQLEFPPKLQLPQSIEMSLQIALEAADELQALLLGPLGFILHQLDGTHNLISLHAINRFKIYNRFPVGEEISFVEMASRCGADGEDMGRLLRHAVTNYIFTEPREGFITHNAISKALADVPMLHEWVATSCEDMWPPTSRVVDAMTKWPGSSDPKETAFNLASGAHGTFFEELEQSPERSGRFSSAMALFKMMPGFEPSLVTEAKLWGATRGVVVDVGGGDGTLAYELAIKHPSLEIFVQDLPSVIANAQHLQNARTTQVKFQAHDFFSEQPIRGADVYLFRMIFHDWSDLFCKRILQQLVPALNAGCRVLINDFCIPDRGAGSIYQERIARCHDLSMKAMFNGKERNKKEWKALLLDADPRFELISIQQKPFSPLALFEVMWKP